jgi:hypothetical protein
VSTIYDRILDYLKKNNPQIEIKSYKGEFTIACPYPHKNKSAPTATIIHYEADKPKFHCPVCGKKQNIFDLVRGLEPDKNNWSDAQISEYLDKLLEANLYPELDNYKERNWTLTYVGRNSNEPIERDRNLKTHYDKIEWIRWLNAGYNIALVTGKVSQATAIDIDVNKLHLVKPEDMSLREEIIKMLDAQNTLAAISAHKGTHYVFQYESEFASPVNLGGLQLDIRNDNFTLVIQPSKIDGAQYTWKDINAPIQKMSPELKAKLLSLKKVDEGRNSINLDSLPIEDGMRQVHEGQGRNSLLVSLGGVVSKIIPEMDKCAQILYLISKTFFVPPTPKPEIIEMVKKLTDYRKDDNETQEQAVWDYCKQMETDLHPADVARAVFNNDLSKKDVVYTYFSKWVMEGKLTREGRGRYKVRQVIAWTDKPPDNISELPYKIPYFQNVAYFQEGDIFIIGAYMNQGKTTLALNLLKGFVDQGIKPYYLYTEAGSRFDKTSAVLGIKGKFWRYCHPDPTTIELEADAVTIIDWLFIGDKSKTDSFLGELNKQMQKKKGLLIIMAQIRQDNTWFAPDLINQFPTYAGRYIRDSADGKDNHFDFDKIKEPKGNFQTRRINFVYDYPTKLILPKDEPC